MTLPTKEQVESACAEIKAVRESREQTIAVEENEITLRTENARMRGFLEGLRTSVKIAYNRACYKDMDALDSIADAIDGFFESLK